MCDLETQRIRSPWPSWGCFAKLKRNISGDICGLLFVLQKSVTSRTYSNKCRMVIYVNIFTHNQHTLNEQFHYVANSYDPELTMFHVKNTE